MRGPHKRVDCASCHTALIGGYAFNFWSAVGPKGNENPLTRIQDYLVAAVSPLIIRNPKGIWIPVHIVPHASGNVKADEVVLSRGLIFRNSPDVTIDRLYYSNDAYAVTGLVRNLDNKDHDTMVWLNADRVAHATGKSRGCGSCHDSATQTIITPYTEGSYKDVGEGRYAVIADERGIRVKLLKEADATPLPDGLAPFTDKWAVGGNFAFPKIKDHTKYEKLEKKYQKGTFVH
jgi:cytochrome c551/c552